MEEKQCHYEETEETTEKDGCVLESKIQSIEKDLARIREYLLITATKRKMPPNIYVQLHFPVYGSCVCYHREIIKIRSYSETEMLVNEVKFLEGQLAHYKKELEELK